MRKWIIAAGFGVSGLTFLLGYYALSALHEHTLFYIAEFGERMSREQLLDAWRQASADRYRHALYALLLFCTVIVLLSWIVEMILERKRRQAEAVAPRKVESAA